MALILSGGKNQKCSSAHLHGIARTDHRFYASFKKLMRKNFSNFFF
jgi:hypothetical protein